MSDKPHNSSDPAAEILAKRTAYSLAREVLGLRAQVTELEAKNSTLTDSVLQESDEIEGVKEMLENSDEVVITQRDWLTSLALRAGVIEYGTVVPDARHVQQLLTWMDERKADSAALVETRTDLDGVAAQFGEIGRLVPTDYQDRSELFGALLRIIQKVPTGARARAEASALSRYAMRLHEQHDWRDHLLVEADRIEQNAKELNEGEAS